MLNTVKWPFNTARRDTAKTRLGDLLVARRIITKNQLELALDLQQQRRANKSVHSSNSLGNILIELGYIKPIHLSLTLSWQERLRKTALAMALIPTLGGVLTGCGGGSGGGSAASAENTQTSISQPLNTTNNTSTNNINSSESEANLLSTQPQQSLETPISEVNQVNTSITQLPATANNEATPEETSSENDSEDSAQENNTEEITSESHTEETTSENSTEESVAENDPEEAAEEPEASMATGSIRVRWSTPTSREDGSIFSKSEIDHFLLEIRHEDSSEFEQLEIDDPTIQRYDIVNLIPGTYEVRVATVDVNGLTSAYSTSTVEIL